MGNEEHGVGRFLFRNPAGHSLSEPANFISERISPNSLIFRGFRQMPILEEFAGVTVLYCRGDLAEKLLGEFP